LKVLANKGRLAFVLIVLSSFVSDATQAAEQVRIGVLKLSSAAPLFLAKDRGYFEQEGIDADLKFFDAAVPIAVATVSGDIDVGFTGPSIILRARVVSRSLPARREKRRASRIRPMSPRNARTMPACGPSPIYPAIPSASRRQVRPSTTLSA